MSARIPAISLWQPWASLMVYGIKRNETRSWFTSHRGPLVIHAAKVSPFGNRDVPADVLQAATITLNQRTGMQTPLPLGFILGIVNVVDCVKAEDLPNVAPVERMFGDYAKGRYAWVTDGFVRLENPLPCRGAQGIFKIPAYKELLPLVEDMAVLAKHRAVPASDSPAHAELTGGGA